MLAALSRPIDVRSIGIDVTKVTHSLCQNILCLLPSWLFQEEPRVELVKLADQSSFSLSLKFGKEIEETEKIDIKSIADYLSQTEMTRQRQVPIELILGEGDFLRKTFTLPRRSQQDLHQAVELQIDIETPFLPSNVYFSALTTSTSLDKTSLDVDVILAPKDVVSRKLDELSEYGVIVHSLGVSGTPGLGRDHQIPLTSPRRQSRWKLAAIAALTCFAVISVVFSIWLPLKWKADEADMIEAKADLAVSTARKMDAELSKTTGELKDLQVALQEKKSHPPFITILKAVTAAVPDSSYLEHFSYRKDQIQLSGFSDSTSALVDKLSRDPLLSTPSYLSPSYRQGTDKEHFDLSFHLIAGNGK